MKKVQLALSVALLTAAMIAPNDLFGRGFGGGRGGGGGGAPHGGGGGRPAQGGGGARPAMGGGGGARPQMSRPQASHPQMSRPAAGHTGSFSRPGGMGQRPGMSGGNRPTFAGGNQPGMGGGRPNIGGQGRPNMGAGNRPNMNNRPGFANRPGAGGGGIQNPAIANRPGMGPGNGNRPPHTVNRPNLGAGGDRNPWANNRPGMRPGAGGGGVQRPNLPDRPSTRPGFAGWGVQRPNLPDRPGTRPGQGGGGIQNPNLPDRPTTRPGQGGGGIQNPNLPDRPFTRPGQGGGGDRGPINNDRPWNRPGWNGGGEQWAGGNNRPWNRPGWNGGGEQWNRPGWNNRPDWTNNNFNINNINNNFISNRSWNNDWQHGNWNGSGWGSGYWNNNVGWGGGGWGGGGWGGYWNGYANGFSNGYWDRPWYAQPLAWGLGAWSLGSVFYNSGYMSYSNPYYTSAVGVPVYYDYSQPIQVVSETYAMPVDTAVASTDDATATQSAYPAEVQESVSHSEQARTKFYEGDYVGAMNEIDLALQKVPNDAAVHELRGLVQFATKDYQAAAGTLYAVLSAGPGWDWTTMSSLYPSVDTYTQQLRDLEGYVKAHPDDAASRFVLAYHYITAGHNDAAVRQLKKVTELQPSDQLSAQLLKLVGGEPEKETTEQPPSAADPAATPAEPPTIPDIDEKLIVGKWTAKRDDGSTFVLDLASDEKFTWDYSHGDKKGQEFSGKYSVDGAILVLARSDGAQMPGLVTMEKDGFNFKLYGGPENDPGLDFRK